MFTNKLGNRVVVGGGGYSNPPFLQKASGKISSERFLLLYNY